MHNKSVYMLQVIAEGLRTLIDKVVFTGGAVVSLYLDNKGIEEPRPTEDVDCVVEISKWIEYINFENKLREFGFENYIGENTSICKWIYKGVKVDFMPTDESILGFSNYWYNDGLKNSIKYTLPDHQVINIFKIPYFIATKIEAFKGREGEDFRFSPDIEDIITVINGNANVIQEIKNSPSKLKKYLVSNFSGFINNNLFVESIHGFLASEENSRIEYVLSVINDIVS